jgi:hypothetical protein
MKSAAPDGSSPGSTGLPLLLSGQVALDGDGRQAVLE